MGHYQSLPDACFGIVLLLTAWEALAMGCGNFDVVYRVPSFFHVQSLVVQFTIMLLSSCVARWQLIHSRIRWWTYCGILLPTLWVMFFSRGWFTSGFHDLAMDYFDSHGRFGCREEQSYIFRDDTAPWILHGPLSQQHSHTGFATVPFSWRDWPPWEVPSSGGVRLMIAGSRQPNARQHRRRR